jgi:hypothetical protein
VNSPGFIAPPKLGLSGTGIVFALAALLFAGAPRSFAQCAPGELRVFVKDSQESSIYNARVTLLARNAPRVLTTESVGVADFTAVPCGSWQVKAAKEGFTENTVLVQMTGLPLVQVSIALAPVSLHSSLEVSDKAPGIEQSASESNELTPSDVKPLPGNPATITDTLPLVPGIERSRTGALILDGTTEQRSAYVVNQSDGTDPATGEFGPTLPVDAIQTVNVLNVPFLAQYGRFTRTVVAVETRRGGPKWHFDINDLFPDFRIRSYHMVGIRNETPRLALGGPIIPNRFFINSAIVYVLDKVVSRTLGFPHNESKQESINWFTDLAYILSPSQVVTATLHVSPRHVNFVNPDFFNPPPVTPTYAQHDYVGTLADHYGLWNGLLDSSVSFQRFNAYVGSQGPGDMIMTPEGNQGNYFASQRRDAARTEWLEHWSPTPVTFLGVHQFKIGSSWTRSSDEGQFSDRPINILSTAGSLLESIRFSNALPFNRSDTEISAFVQDHWSIAPNLSLDYGGRIEHQRLAENLRMAPRIGVAWNPFNDERTVLRFGWGQFYDHIPLDVYTFGRYPTRVITQYAPDGTPVAPPVVFTNVIGSATGPRSFFVRGEQVAGAFSPRGDTWNAQFERIVNSHLRLRAVLIDNRSVGLIILTPEMSEGSNEIVLNGNGNARYWQAELTAKVSWGSNDQLVFSYVRAHSRGDLNTFDSFLGNFATPLVRNDLYSNLPGDMPNRLVVWGHVNTHLWKVQVLPTIEYRTGFPYARLDELQNYVGVPYSSNSRFPDFFSADARVMRDFKFRSKYNLRLSLTGFNLSNHFNALAVHDNVADPQYGVFFGNWHRRYRFDFEVLF